MTGMGLLSATPSRYFAYHPVEGGKSFTMNITLPIVNLSNFLLKHCSKVGLIIMLLLPVWQIQAQVDLVLSPVTSTVDVGENLTLTLQVIAGTEEINGVSAFLDFDPAFVTISSVEYNASAQLPVPLPNAGESDPTGKIDNSYGTFGAPATGTFDFITINLTATAAGTTTIDFAFEADANPQRLTSVTASDGQGTLLLGTATGATITIVDPAANTPPTVSITSPLDGATYAEGEEVVLAATAEDADGSVSSVEFFDGTTSLGIDTEAPFSATLANAAAGAHDFTAVATDNDGATTTSATVTVTASTPATEPVVTVGGPAAKMVAEGGSLQIPVSISDLDGDNLTVIITSISNEPKLLESSTGSGTQVDPYPLSADAFLTVSDEVNNPGVYSANLNFTPTFGDGGGADGDGDGVYTVTVTVSDGNSSVNTDFTLTVTDVAQPLSTTATTRIEAESFDNQGPPNSGSNPGNKGIGAEINDATGIINIGFTHVGDFAEYEIDVPQAGTYDFSFEVAKGSNGTGTMQIRVQDGGPALGAISVTKTANWLTYETVAASVDLPAGPQTLRFDWSAGSGFLFNIDYFDVSFAGDAAPVVAITSPADGSTFEEGSTVTVTVDATDDGGVTQVELFDGTTSLGIDTEAPYAFSILNGTGTYVLTAEASDGTATTTSEAVTITAVGANTAPVVSIVAPLDGAAVSRGTDITLTATVNDAEESGLEAGLQWTSSDTQLSTDPVSGTGASITGQLVTPGTQTITATATDSGNLTGSDVVTVTVAGPQVAFTAPADNATLSSTNVQLQWTATDVLYDLTEHFHLYVNPAELNDLSSVDHISTASEIGQTSWDLTEADGLTAGENTVVIRVANQFHEVFLTDPNDPTSFIQDVVTFTVNVPDVTAPVITLLGDNPLNLSVGDAYTEFGATATDNIDGDLTASIAIDASTVDVNTEGTYTVAYSVSDAAGNLATAARTVSVAAGVELPDPCENTLYRINVGGPATPSADATPLGWSADQGNFTSANNSQYLVAMTGGNSIYKGDASNAHGGPIIMTDPSVPTSAPAGIFFTERYDLDSNPEMKWEFPIAPGTEVQVTLLFAELYGPVDAAGQRIFDVSLEGTVLPAFDGIDPIAIAGPKGAFSRSATLTVTDGTLDIEFLHTGNDNPALKGIQICGISAPADDTPPVITLLGDNPLELQVGATYTDPGATATDDVDGDLTAAIVVAGDAVDTSVDGTYVVTYNVTDAAGNAATEVSRTVTVSPVVSNPIVQIEILPGADLDASTFGGSNNFQIANQSTGSLQVTSVTFDLSTGILPDMVFDPTGTGGDETAQCFNAGGSASAVGLVTPANACVDPFSGARNGGFDVLSMDFTDFDPGEIFTFSVDVDPNSIQGVPGAGAAGAVSGYELVGATLTLTFSDGSTLVSSLYEDGSLGGSQAVVSAGAPVTPTIAVVGIASAPATVSDLDQIVTVSGTPGDHVSLLVMDSRLYINSGAPPFGVSEVTYYANEAMSGKGLYTAIIEAGGTVDIPVTLLVTESGNTTPNGGLNQLIAVTSVGPYAADQAVSNTSNVITLLYDSNEAPVAVASANVLTGPAPLEVLFDGSGSSDSDGTISSYEWTWDGGTASGVSPTVTFAEGTYEVTLTVTDDDNATATDQLTLVVGESDDDGDGVANGLDNCPTVANVDQLDTDNDGLGDVCDDDIDGDGILNADDCAPLDDQIGAATVDFTVEVDPSDASGLTFTLMGSSTVPVTSWAYTVDGQPLATTADASVTLASASETVNVCLEIVTDCGTVQVCQEVTATFQSQPGCDLVRFGGGINYISFDVLPEEGQRSISQVLGAAAGRMIYIQRRTPFGEVQTYIPIAPSIGTDFDIVPGEAYLVFATQPGQINLCGNTVDPDFRMAIPGGYAWVGYVPSAETTPTEYFGTIPGLFYALGRRGDFTFGDSEYYVPSQPNQTSLTRVANGEGYEVLTFGGGASQGSWLNGPKSFPPVDPRPLKHASRVYTVLYGTAQALQAGDVISVVDTEGVVHAELQVEEDGSIHTTTVFGYDELTQANPELQVGEELYFEFDGMVADQTLSFRGKGGIERIELTFAQTTSVNTSVAGPTMTAYPNPFLEELTVDVPLQVVGRLHITLIDARGRVVADEWIENSISTQGTQTVKLATQNLPVGMYLLRCDLAGEGIMTRKLQRVR